MNTVLNPLTCELDIGGTWRTSLFVGMSFCLVVYLKSYIGRIGWFLSALWAYALLYALYLFEFPALPFGDYNRAFEATAGAAFAEILIIPLAALSITRPIWNYFIPVMCYEIICVWIGYPGLLVAPSFDTAFLALFLPFAPMWLAALSVATILSHHGSTALTIIGAQIVAYAVTRGHARGRAALLALPVLAAAAWFHHHGALLDGSERIEKWRAYTAFWNNQEWYDRVFGIGPGSYMWTAAMLDNWRPPLFLQEHCDWLQIPFELGWVGLTLAVGSLVRAVRRAWEEPKLLSALFGAAAFACTYHPLRWFPTAFLTALIFAASCRTDSCPSRRPISSQPS